MFKKLRLLLSPDESNSSEIPPVQVPPENQIPPVETPATVPAPPPAAELVTKGIVKNERELELEKKLLDAERHAAELERDLQNVITEPPAPTAPPPAPEKKPAKVKRARLFPTILNLGGDDE